MFFHTTLLLWTTGKQGKNEQQNRCFNIKMSEKFLPNTPYLYNIGKFVEKIKTAL
jgi:hypothetical protein